MNSGEQTILNWYLVQVLQLEWKLNKYIAVKIFPFTRKVYHRRRAIRAQDGRHLTRSPEKRNKAFLSFATSQLAMDKILPNEFGSKVQLNSVKQF